MALKISGGNGGLKIFGNTGRLVSKVVPNIPTIVKSGLILHLDASDPASYTGSGATWHDLSGNGNDATLYNSPTYTNSNGGEITFDGSSQYAQGPGLGSHSSWTASIWVNFVTFGTSGTTTLFTDMYGSGKVNFSIWQPYVGYVYGAFYSEGQWKHTSTHAVSLATWYNCSVTYDGTNLAFYLNGVQVDTSSIAASSMGDNVGYRVARRWDTPDYANITTGAALFYGRPLTSDEVLYNFNVTKGRFGF